MKPILFSHASNWTNTSMVSRSRIKKLQTNAWCLLVDPQLCLQPEQNIGRLSVPSPPLQLLKQSIMSIHLLLCFNLILKMMMMMKMKEKEKEKTLIVPTLEPSPLPPLQCSQLWWPTFEKFESPTKGGALQIKVLINLSFNEHLIFNSKSNQFFFYLNLNHFVSFHSFYSL